MAISIIISINGDVVQIHNNENVKLFGKDLIDVFLEACCCVCWPEKHYLVLKVTVLSFEHGLLFVLFADSYLMVCTGQVELGKPTSPF